MLWIFIKRLWYCAFLFQSWDVKWWQNKSLMWIYLWKSRLKSLQNKMTWKPLNGPHLFCEHETRILHAWLNTCALPGRPVDPKGNVIWDMLLAVYIYTPLLSYMIQMSKHYSKYFEEGILYEAKLSTKKIWLSCLFTVSSRFAGHDRHLLVDTGLFSHPELLMSFWKI